MPPMVQNPVMTSHRLPVSVLISLGICASSSSVLAQLSFTDVQRQTNNEISFSLSAPIGRSYLVEASTNGQSWNGLVTFPTNATTSLQYTDSAAPFLPARYYRATRVETTNVLSGDHLTTTNGDIIIRPVDHAGVALQWSNVVIYSDPASGIWTGLPRPDIILITHNHTDHYQPTVLAGVWKPSTTLFVSPFSLPSFPNNTVVLTEGNSTNILGVNIQAVAAYNAYHTRGQCNGYVLTIGGKRIYISGDTGNQPEIRALPNIDVAFLCINIPFTMTAGEATNCVRAMQPRVVYPYHYRDQSGATTNAATFKRWLGTDLGIEVRLRKWY
jgi:L-ascorbate metabolism protein UlaG (beta-lactamase superfamily)